MSFLAYEWTFLKVFWAMLAFFAFVIVVWLIVMVLYDNFARHDHSGLAKAGWTLFVIFLPLLGVLVYMIVRSGSHEPLVSCPGCLVALGILGRRGLPRLGDRAPSGLPRFVSRGAAR